MIGFWSMYFFFDWPVYWIIAATLTGWVVGFLVGLRMARLRVLERRKQERQTKRAERILGTSLQRW